ncbi:MAG: hypothetical protein LBE02_08230 [Spirochaetaceae bacterium]|jgi:hypothetical protein|nr:hypothetical protein [Spirochaetaceae bacterium]
MPLDPMTLKPGQSYAKKDFDIAYSATAWQIVMGQWLFFATKKGVKGYRNELQSDGLIYETSPKAANELVPHKTSRPCYVHVLYRIKPQDDFTYLGLAQTIAGYDPGRNKLVFMLPSCVQGFIGP